MCDSVAHAITDVLIPSCNFAGLLGVTPPTIAALDLIEDDLVPAPVLGIAAGPGPITVDQVEGYN